MCWKWNWKIKWLLWQMRDDGGGTVQFTHPWVSPEVNWRIRIMLQGNYHGQPLYGYYTLVPDAFCYKVFTAIGLCGSCKKKTAICNSTNVFFLQRVKEQHGGRAKWISLWLTMAIGNNILSPSRWQCDLRRRSAAAVLLGSRVRVLPREDACPLCLSCAI
jgi:hypothetical protein